MTVFTFHTKDTLQFACFLELVIYAFSRYSHYSLRCCFFANQPSFIKFTIICSTHKRDVTFFKWKQIFFWRNVKIGTDKLWYDASPKHCNCLFLFTNFLDKLKVKTDNPHCKYSVHFE